MIDLEGLTARLGGQPRIVKSLLEGFARDGPGLMQGLVDALEAGEFDRARHLAHTLKGTLLWIGAPAPAEAAGALEAGLADQPGSVPKPQLATLISKVEDLLDDLRVKLREFDA